METTLGSQIGGIHGNLERLISQLNEFVTKIKSTGGIAARAEHDNDQLSVVTVVNRLRQDWEFIDLLVKCILRGNAAAAAAKKLLVQNSKDVADAINVKLFSLVQENLYENYYLETPQEILNLLGECQRKTDKLCNTEIQGALAEFAVEGKVGDVAVHFEIFDLFLPLLAKNLQLMKDIGGGTLDKVQNELLWIHRYLNAVQKDVVSSDFGNDVAIGAFLTRAELLVLKIAFQSCNLWFNKTNREAAQVVYAAILDLQREIEPSNPEFLRLALDCQRCLYRMNSKTASVTQFCSYILLETGNDGLFSKEVNSLITLYFGSTLEDDGQDVQSLFTEILAVLGEAAFSFRRGVPEGDSALSLIKIILLNAELFLKEQIHTRTPSMMFGDSPFFMVNMFFTGLGTMIEDRWMGILSLHGNTFVKDSMELCMEVGNKIISLQGSFHFKKINNTSLRHSLLQLLFRITFFKSESLLINLLKSDDANISVSQHEKDQIIAIIEYLQYFKRIMMNYLTRNSSTEAVIIRQVEATIRDITLLSYLYLPVCERFLKIRSSLPTVLDKAKIIKARLGEIDQQFSYSIFPKINALGSIGRNITELLKQEPQLIGPFRHHIQQVLSHLESLESFVSKVKDLDAELGEWNDLGNQVIEVAYKLEYVVHTIEADGHLQQSLWLYDLLEDIKFLDQKVSEIPEMPYGRLVNNSPRTTSLMVSPNTTAEINEMLINLVDEEEAIVQSLTRGSAQRDVVSIVGMPGIGKTTLARKVYNSLSVTYHFHRRAWCTVSQTYSKRELLLEIMSHLPILTDEISRMSEDDLLHKLRQCLLGNRYLIVMDDIWDTAAWNDFSHCFPNDNNGSRILITSRLQDVVLKIKPGCDPHSISLLSDAQSWMLLQKKIFGVEVCPEGLMESGLEIAQYCQGLPLAVVTIAGLLQTIEKSEESWKAVAKSFSSEIIDNPESRCRKILEVSYKHLPEHLKACFLYYGVFLENKDIPANKLMRYWLAEGFIKEIESKSLEEVAEEYLLELINRSLVNVSKRRSNGKARTCRLHDLLLDLCRVKAKEENFLQVVTINDEPYSSYPDSEYGLESDGINQSAPTSFESYRLSFLLKRQHFIDSRPLGLGVRSLTFFASMDMEPKCPYDISFICNNFKLLRLLDLEYIMTIDFPVEIGVMVQLRYLAVSGYMQSIPSSIANLWRLETLIVKGLRGKVLLPDSIWTMVSLKHLHVNSHVAFSMNGDKQLGSSCLLPNLISFSTPSFSCGENMLNILRRVPNLRKLRCNFIHSGHSSEDCSGFPVLEFLTCLESLKIIYKGRAINSGDFVRLPSNIKKLTLSNFSLLENHLSTIGQLPNLRVLKLLAASFEEPTWVMKEGEFMELTFLELDCMNIVEWDASFEHLPSLQQLVLRNCKDLTAIPSDFAYITTLTMIEVQWCGQSVVESAEEIRDATEEIEVRITRF